jgi:hypothetical protein
MLRRTIGFSVAATAIGLGTILPAAAQTSPTLDSYAAGAKATALELTAFGQSITVSQTVAGIDSAPKAVADGHALLTPGFSSPGAPVTSTGALAEGSDCQEIALPSPINLAALDLVCIATRAIVEGTNPISGATSEEVVIEIEAADLIADTPLADVVGEVQAGLGQLFDALTPITEPISEETQIELDAIVDGLLSEVQEGDVLVRITVAPTASAGERLQASATSNGVIVELLPNLPGGALAVATVGASSAGVVRDITQPGAPVTLTGSPALINVTYPNGLLGGLGVITDALGEAVNVTIDQLACGPENPLSDVLCFTLGGTNDLDAAEAKALGLDFGPTTVGRETSVLSLSLLGAAPEGGVVLHVGHTAAAAGAAYVAPEQPGLPRVDNPLEEARTGGGDAALPLTLGLLAVGTAGAVLVRRTRSTV